MSKVAHDIFTLVVNFLEANWQPKDVIIGFFKANETTEQAFVKSLVEFKLIHMV
jgi:hypothetical protein